MNNIFEVPPEASGGIKGLIIKRALSFVMVLCMGALVVASLVASAFFMNLAELFSGISGGTEIIIQILDVVLLTFLLGVVFAVLIKLLPDTKIDWKHALKGGLITGVLFSIGKYLIALYLAHKGIGSAYGAAGSVVLIMLWVYYSAMIFFLGAEITYVLWKRDQKGVTAEQLETEREDEKSVQREAIREKHA